MPYDKRVFAMLARRVPSGKSNRDGRLLRPIDRRGVSDGIALAVDRSCDLRSA